MLLVQGRQIDKVVLEFFWLYLWVLAGRNVAFGSSFASIELASPCSSWRQESSSVR